MRKIEQTVFTITATAAAAIGISMLWLDWRTIVRIFLGGE